MTVQEYRARMGRLLQGKDHMLIEGKWVKSSSGQSFPTYDPATEEKLCEVPLAMDEDVD